jgi:hypothetical protein
MNPIALRTPAPGRDDPAALAGALQSLATAAAALRTADAQLRVAALAESLWPLRTTLARVEREEQRVAAALREAVARRYGADRVPVGPVAPDYVERLAATIVDTDAVAGGYWPATWRKQA